MKIRIEPYTENRVFEVTQFNRRLRQGGVRFQFPDAIVPEWLPKVEGRSLYQEYFVAVDEDDKVRGGYILKHQQFLVGTTVQEIGNYQLPLSEGTIDKAYATVAMLLLTHALQRQKLLYALGMGGKDRPLPKMLSAMGWRVQTVPFHFRVCHPQSFLRNLSLLRERPAWRLLSTVASATGVGPLGILSLQASRRKKRTRLGRASTEVVTEFDQWANEVWQAHGADYSFVAVRNKPVLTVLYPGESKRYYRLLVQVDGRPAGWVVVLDTQMKDHKQFGSMRVGTIADCFAAPEHADAVIGGATDFLEERGVDLVVSNQAHPWWCSALANSGFLVGPSNFVLATSRDLTKTIESCDAAFERVHVNRGDGDGPIHL